MPPGSSVRGAALSACLSLSNGDSLRSARMRKDTGRLLTPAGVRLGAYGPNTGKTGGGEGEVMTKAAMLKRCMQLR